MLRVLKCYFKCRLMNEKTYKNSTLLMLNPRNRPLQFNGSTTAFRAPPDERPAVARCREICRDVHGQPSGRLAERQPPEDATLFLLLGRYLRDQIGHLGTSTTRKIIGFTASGDLQDGTELGRLGE